MVQVYTNAKALLGDNLELADEVTIVVEGETIADVLREQLDDGEDLQGALVIPAFVDAHTHIGDTAAKELGIGLKVEAAVAPPNGLKHRFLRSLSREELVASMRQGMLEMLKSGIAAFGDFREEGLEGVLALKEAAQGLPIKPVILGRPIADANKGLEVIQEEVRQILEVADGLGISSVNVFPVEIMHEFRNLLKDKLLAIHIAESPRSAVRSFEKYGKSEIARALEFEPDLMIHLTNATDEDLKLLSEHKQPIACCPRTNCLLGDGIPPLAAMLKSKINFGLGTDNMMFSSPDMFREMDFASRVSRGVSKDPTCVESRSFLQAATKKGADALQIGSKFGTIAKGKSASFLVLNPNSRSFVYSHDLISTVVHRLGPEDIWAFVCQGKDVIKDGKFLLA